MSEVPLKQTLCLSAALAARGTVVGPKPRHRGGADGAGASVLQGRERGCAGGRGGPAIAGFDTNRAETSGIHGRAGGQERRRAAGRKGGAAVPYRGTSLIRKRTP